MGVKYFSNEKFFESWTPVMAYVLGYIYADGSLEDASYLRGKYLRVSSTDRELIELTKKSVNSQHNITLSNIDDPRRKVKYLLRIGSHKIYNDLIKLGVYPNKSLTMKFPKVPKRFSNHFIRGYFDGDGHVGIEKKGRAFKKMHLIFVSGSSDFLVTLADELNTKLNLKINKVYNGWRAYRLCYSTNDSVKIFKYIYKDANGIFLDRKFTVFKRFFIEYNKWADREVRKIIDNYGAMVK
ncbi:MAG TPA: LAGLIDADG family homing endonuclease [Patescibacteria group bacterium]|nr:LAGLIDADG family homing endonuclease [Patescibacteria group bacterium]